MTAWNMEDIGHKVVRLEERSVNQSGEIAEIKDLAKSLLETSRHQSHTIDQILKELEADRVSKTRIRDIEYDVEQLKLSVAKHDLRLNKEEVASIEIDKTFAQAKFVWKIAYAIVTTPVLIVVAIKALEFFQKAS